MSRSAAYFGIARAPFLVLPVSLVACGAAAGAYEGAFSWFRTALALLGLLALHAAVNSLNEASDMRTGIDLNTRRTPFSGGSRTLTSGQLSVQKTVVFSSICSAIGLVVGIWFLSEIGWALLPIILVGAICVLTYTDFLARLGLGEVAAGLGLGTLPVVGTALVQAGNLGPSSVSAALPAFFMTFNLLLLNEFPDEEADRNGGRQNLVILLGRRSAAMLYVIAALSVPLTISASVAAGFLPLITLVAIVPSLILAKPLCWALGSLAKEVPLPALGASVIWILLTNLVLAITLAASVHNSRLAAGLEYLSLCE